MRLKLEDQASKAALAFGRLSGELTPSEQEKIMKSAHWLWLEAHVFEFIEGLARKHDAKIVEDYAAHMRDAYETRRAELRKPGRPAGRS